MQTLTATYSPEDNKLRLYASERLDADLYSRVDAAGFKWAPKQRLFVAPMWTPARENLLIELCGEVGDEDTSLVERAEERADRFEDYSGKRASEAHAAREAVQTIAGRIPEGQPILVGHHSERRARRDAERIENGMRRAVNLWETSGYWAERAKGALRHAKYKEQPGVRHRRMKGLEADRRKYQREIDTAEKFAKLWKADPLTLEKAKAIAQYDHIYFREEGKETSTSIYEILSRENADVEQVRERVLRAHARTIAWYGRWAAHVDNRLEYERAMLGESGGLVTDNADIVVGGTVLIGGEWYVVNRVNKSNGRVNSVTTPAPKVMHWRSTVITPIESVQDYRAPESANAVAAAKPPLANYPGEDFLAMTRAEWRERDSNYKGTRTVAATESHGAYKFRRAHAGRGHYKQVFITDEKRIDPPAPAAPQAASVNVAPQVEPAAVAPVYVPRERTEFDTMREQLKHGVQVVSAPKLFPTPEVAADRMVDEARIEAGDRVGEFSAGTGCILAAIFAAIDPSAIKVTAVEINHALSQALAARYGDVKVICADFMECGAELGTFTKILLNPPFSKGQDIAHIRRALDFLDPGGRLVAICANGPRQQEILLPLVEAHGGTWEELPEGTFIESGTNVRTALLTIDL
ncbi:MULTISPECIES: DUF3560 domain-containing protein [Paraburkholderia]|uniref:DUF3560 domain-containing protein n=1 Tax=Paraburkholderia madseniana TaxID=2599607 RepID=A0AAP5BQI0_9BURK|nr:MULTISPECIES: DUF3560 domain-containing protein [Paraburkholderia]MCX4152342.1 DUF3560 domain-containing protein [Paraburkholderia madseniana]MCX4177848.1 DUF3560 domain-containing protein [Paraburkholderia madseniana]MDN7155271.1 DUF3560 domain-containing protein [Paraburkholderia sp. WS6]MDQ6414154.1 DUF3560 domain-containing protein [Paraburkholderia madseniana]MDQ6465835.1 DUF3560 domain-containing protein [Paraburkholderia madseniana]